MTVALILPLAACLPDTTGEAALGFGKAPETATGLNLPVLPRIELFRGAVVVAGPRGYCIDRQSLRRNATGAFVLIASCESLTGKAGQPVAPAVMTVSVVPDTQGAAPPSAASLAALARPADVLQSAEADGLSVVQLASGGDRLLPMGDPRHWRGGMVINGHIIGLAVYGPAGSAVSGDAGRALLTALAETLRRLSPPAGP